MQLYTAAGRGEYVGGCLVDYALHHRRTGRPVRLPDELPPLANPSSSSSSSSSVSSYDDILRGVWQLEAEIYGDKAEGDGAVVIPPDDILPEDDEARLEAAREAEEQAQAQFRQSEKAKSGR